MNAYNLDEELSRGLISNGSLTIRPRSLIGTYSHFPEDCTAIYISGRKNGKLPTTGVYEIWPRAGIDFISYLACLIWVGLNLGKPIEVLCDMDTDGGGWTVFQRRGNYDEEQTDFYRTWLEYKRGFGNLGREFWLGNDRLSMLTNQDSYRLRIDLEDFDRQNRFAEYGSIRVANEVDKYRLSVGSYLTGDAGDSLSNQNGMQFSTKDQDNDAWPNSCAQVYNGAWWYAACYDSSLNGGYLRGPHPTIEGTSVNWRAFRGVRYSLKATQMKIRPAWFKP